MKFFRFSPHFHENEIKFVQKCPRTFENEHFCHNTNYRMMLDEKFPAGSEQLLGRKGARGYRNPSFYIQPPLLEEKIFSGETEILYYSN